VWKSNQFNIIKQNDTIHCQRHDFAMYFDKLRPTTRKHKNKPEEKRNKYKNTADKTSLHSTVICWNTIFPDPSGVTKTPKHQKR
jgi:hypothetical protein